MRAVELTVKLNKKLRNFCKKFEILAQFSKTRLLIYETRFEKNNG